LKCRRPGARAGIPTLRQTVAFMNTHGDFHD
jgi:hypothetical protein